MIPQSNPTSNRPGRRSESGVALIMVMVISGVAFLMVASVLMSSSTSARLSMRAMAHSRSVAAADAGLEVALSLMQQDLRLHPDGAARVTQQVGSGAYLPIITSVLTQQVEQINTVSASIASLTTTNAGEHLYEITIQAEMADQMPGRSRVSLDLRVIDLPITAFSEFYDIDLEYYPSHDWVVTGPVYCGATTYVRPKDGATLTFAEKVFSVGPILFQAHPLEPDQAPADTVVFLSDKFELVPSMVPMAPAGEVNRMHWILEEPAISDYGTALGNQRFVNKADVIVRLNDSGVTVRQGPRHGNVYVGSSLPYCLNTNVFFWDGRELGDAQGVELDAAEVPAWMASVFGGSAPLHPVLYIADWRTVGAAFNVVRVTNGEVLGANGFTLATPNPLYVKGDFNRDAPKPAMLAADAITVLSSAWEDSNSTSSLASRAAVNTTINAAAIMGMVPPNGIQGSGAGGTPLRLLEHWGGRTLTFAGSTAVLFNSEIAAGVFTHGSYYYRPDVRTYTFVNRFAGMPLADVPTVKMALRSDYKALTPL